MFGDTCTSYAINVSSQRGDRLLVHKRDCHKQCLVVIMIIITQCYAVGTHHDAHKQTLSPHGFFLSTITRLHQNFFLDDIFNRTHYNCLGGTSSSTRRQLALVVRTTQADDDVTID